MMVSQDIERLRATAAVPSCAPSGGFRAGGADLPAAPAWGRLVELFGGHLLRIGYRVDEIASRAPGGFMFVSAAPGDWQGCASALTAEFARLDVAVVSPDLIQDRLTADRWPMDLAQLAHWRRSIRDAASGLVVMPGPAVERSLIVWHDVCAALSSSRPVWVWSGW